ncbi:hypothetical protein H4R26_003165 [Coemansia thaxteri]|uniref:NAD-dependent epimerase/dehydratase domain-containing protein n=1 Tax=Coemansia thaxteri TaxID=2663907 RepID=A0A9W8EEX6_9FUNG|nr:hypothetical protein H4R26_003165 [Coemansia thaxteri]KAJ2484021.1 hypothetical protein EV174_002775 [Coemansia sp. RSA 2320]
MTSVLVLGANGYIGKEVSRAFSRAGFRVYGLVRSEEKGKALAQDEVITVVGDVSRPESLAEHFDGADVIVDASVDFSNPAAYTKGLLNAVKQSADRRAARGGQLTFVLTSGGWVHGNTGHRGISQDSAADPLPGLEWRRAAEQDVLALGQASNIRSVVVRPSLVYGRAGGFFASVFAGLTAGSIRLPGSLENSLTTIHVDDLAELYVSVVERAPLLNGLALTAANRSSESVRDIISAVRRLDAAREIGVEAYTPAHLFDEGVAITQVVDTRSTRALTAWEPRKRSFVEGVAEYFYAWNATTQHRQQ